MLIRVLCSVVLLRQGELILRLKRRARNVSGPYIVAPGVHTVNGVGYLLAPYLRAVELIGLEGIVYIAAFLSIQYGAVRPE